MSDLRSRFEASNQAEPNSGCWLWTGELGSGGYGRLKVGGRRVPAHRISLALVGRDVPAGFEVDHLCRNPPCVNPAHLDVVTHAENMRRAARGQRARPTHCPHGHALQGDNIQLGRKPTHRRCRTCVAAKNRAAYLALVARHGPLRAAGLRSTGGAL